MSWSFDFSKSVERVEKHCVFCLPLIFRQLMPLLAMRRATQTARLVTLATMLQPRKHARGCQVLLHACVATSKLMLACKLLGFDLALEHLVVFLTYTEQHLLLKTNTTTCSGSRSSVTTATHSYRHETKSSNSIHSNGWRH